VAVLIDTHAHLDAEKFAGDLPAVLERARAAGCTLPGPLSAARRRVLDQTVQLLEMGTLGA